MPQGYQGYFDVLAKYFVNYYFNNNLIGSNGLGLK
jgi:hypothetical protein